MSLYLVILSRYQSTFWMEPRVIPVKYTTEVNFNLESPIRRFTEKIDLQVKIHHMKIKFILVWKKK